MVIDTEFIETVTSVPVTATLVQSLEPLLDGILAVVPPIPMLAALASTFANSILS